MSSAAERGDPAGAATLAFCFLVLAVEAFDIASLGLAAPKLAPQMRLAPQQLGLVLSGVPLGMFLGALVGGRLADGIGRKRALILAILVTAAFQLATAFASTYGLLLAARISCGVGIGMAIPNVFALAAEAAGAQGSVFNVTLVGAGMQFGGFAGSLIAIAGGEHGDWRTIFYVGGLATSLIAPVLALALPESRAYLSARAAQSAGFRAESVLSVLFGGVRGAATLWLWIAAFATAVILYVIVTWTPQLMALKGFSRTAAVTLATAIGVGGLVGPIAVGYLMERRRSVGVLLACYLGLVVGLFWLSESGHDFAATYAAVALAAALVQAASFTLNGLASLCYPTARRGAGIGAAVAAARLGAIAGPATTGFLLGAGFGVNQVLQSLIPVALAAGLAAAMLLVAGRAALQVQPATA